MHRDPVSAGGFVAHAAAGLQRAEDTVWPTLGQIATAATGLSLTAKPVTPRSANPNSRGAEGMNIVCTTQASVTIRDGIDGRRQFVLHGPLDDLDGSTIGRFEGVYQTKVFSQSDLIAYPEPPSGPFDRPYRAGEPEWTPPLNPTKSEWNVETIGHVLRGSGLGLSRISVQPGGATTFWYGVTSFVSRTQDGHDQARGQATSLATAVFPTVPSLVDGMSFETEIIHTLSLAPVA